MTSAATAPAQREPELAGQTVVLTFRYAGSFRAAHGLEGYERLLLDAMLSDQSLFTRSDAIERLWEISAPLLENPPAVQPYAPGLVGPAARTRPPRRAAPLASARHRLTLVTAGPPGAWPAAGPIPAPAVRRG